MTPSCSHVKVSGGLADLSMPRHVRGQVGCLREIIQTHTTLATRTISSSTVISTVSTFFTTPTTQFYAPRPFTTAEGTLTASQLKTHTAQSPERPTHNKVPTPTQTSTHISEITAAPAVTAPESDVTAPPIVTVTDSDVTTVPVVTTAGSDITAPPILTATNSDPAHETIGSSAVSDTTFMSSGYQSIPAVSMTLFTTLTTTVTQWF